MKKALLLFSLFLAVACARSDNDRPVVEAPERKAVVKPRSVIRSGRKDPLLKSDYVRSVLGEPSVKRREEPSEVWAYSRAGCVLFIYMNDRQDGEPLVRYMEIGTPTFQASQKNSLPCLEAAAKLR